MIRKTKILLSVFILIVASCDNSTNLSTSGLISSNGFEFEEIDDYLYLKSYVGKESEIDIPSSYNGIDVKEIGYGAFAKNIFVTKVNIAEGIEKIGVAAFDSCSSITEVIIPTSVTGIEEGAFNSCTNLISIIIPEGVTILNSYVFSQNSNLKNISLPTTLEKIDNAAFSWCVKLEQIEIPENVTSITDSVFIECDSLISIKIPSSVISIGEFSFGSCELLKTIEFWGTTPPEIKADTFTGVGGTSDYFENIIVPKGYQDTYENLWNADYLTQVTIIEVS